MMLEPAIYIVATPIGNLKDITHRGIEILSNVDKIAAEDTRHSRKLLQHYSITTPLISLHEHNEAEKSKEIIDFVKADSSIALISDAGTPLVSDPGYRLVAKAKEDGVKVIPVPGACALIAALSASGIATDTFKFIGFLPTKLKAKEEYLSSHIGDSSTVIFYESPHRIDSTLEVIKNLLLNSNRKVTLAKELTKKFETIITSDITTILDMVKKDSELKRGEFVFIIEGIKSSNSSTLDYETKKIIDILAEELPTKQASSIASKITGINKNTIYEYVLDNK